MGRKVGPGLARNDTLPGQKGDPAWWVTLLVELTFCLSCKRFAAFSKETYRQLARPGSSGTSLCVVVNLPKMFTIIYLKKKKKRKDEKEFNQLNLKEGKPSSLFSSTASPCIAFSSNELLQIQGLIGFKTT